MKYLNMQTDRTIAVENTDPDQMDTLEDNILSDQMDISDDDQMDWQVTPVKQYCCFDFFFHLLFFSVKIIKKII
jgi:hypothetical protein